MIAEPAAGTQHGVEPVELASGVMEVFGGLRAGDEVVGLRQRFAVGLEERVVERHLVARFAHDCRESRSRTAAVVEPAGAVAEFFQERSGEL